MARKVKASDVQRARADWYQFHYENRETFKSLSVDKQHVVMQLTAMMPPLQMTVFGGFSENWMPTLDVFRLAGQYDVDVHLLCIWYVSDNGWSQFQALWNELPEPVGLYTSPCVQVGELYQVSTVSEISTPPR